MPSAPPVPPWPPTDPGQAIRVGSHRPRNSEVTFPHLMPQTTPGQASVAAARSRRSSRSFVPTVAPFQPLSLQKDLSINRQNPLLSETPSSQVPRKVEHVESQRPNLEDFPALPPIQPCASPVKGMHITKIVDPASRGKAKARTSSGDSNDPTHTKEKSRIDNCSCPVTAKQVSMSLSSTKSKSPPATSIQTTTVTRITTLKSDPGVSNERISVIRSSNDRLLPTPQSHPTTSPSQTMDHRTIPNGASKVPKDSGLSKVDNCAPLSNAYAPPGITSSAEHRLQNIQVLQAEAENIDRLAAEQTDLSGQDANKIERSSNTGSSVNNELWQQTHLETKQQDSKHPETNKRLAENIHKKASATTSWGLVNPLHTFEAEEEYRHVLSDPNHIFWKNMLDFQTSHNCFPTADSRKQQLVSLFEMALKNLCGHIEDHSDFQDPPVSALARCEDRDSRILRHQANLIDRWGIPNWNMPGVRDSLIINRDFRNNACHVPYIGPLRATILQSPKDLGKSAMASMDVTAPFYSANPLGPCSQRFQSPISERDLNLSMKTRLEIALHLRTQIALSSLE